MKKHKQEERSIGRRLQIQYNDVVTGEINELIRTRLLHEYKYEAYDLWKYFLSAEYLKTTLGVEKL